MWGLLLGFAFFWVPGVGLLMVSGAIVAWILGALDGAAVVGDLSALGAAFYSIGNPNDSILQHETAIKAEKLLLAADGTPNEVTNAERLLAGTSAMHTRVHAGSGAIA